MSRFAAVPTAALDDPRLDGTHIRVLTALCSYTDKDGWCRVRLAKVAERARSGETRTSSCITDLVEWGWVEKMRFGQGHSNAYQVIMDRPFDPEISVENDIEEEPQTSPVEKQDFPSGEVRLPQSGNPIRTPFSNTVLNTVSGRKKKPSGANDPMADKIWTMTPEPSRKRSSRKELAAALSGLPADISGERIAEALSECLSDPQMMRDGYKYLPAIHRWIRDGRYESFLPKKKDLLAQAISVPPAELQRAVEWYIETGQWDLTAYSPAPHKPGCKVPGEFLTKATERIEIMRKMEGKS